VVTVIGLGDGSLLEALERRAPGTKVLALEPSADAARSVLVLPRVASWRQSGRLVYLAGPDFTGAENAWRIFPSRLEVAPPILLHPSAAGAADAARALAVCKKIVFGALANARARRRFAPRYLLNSIRNLPAIVAGRDVRALTRIAPGAPAVITGAGPSLDASLPELARLADRALIVATDTSLRPLLAHGIVPHLVVGLDPSDANGRHLLSLPPCSKTWLVAESALDPRAIAAFAERTFWFRVAPHQPWPWYNEQGVDVGRLEVWGSVLTGAFQVACLAGCDPIVMLGSDLSFPAGRPYARGTTYEFDWALAAAEGTPVEETWRMQLTGRNDIRLIRDVTGADTRTTGAMLQFRDWMVAQARKSGRRVVNASGAGMLFGSGVEQGLLADLLTGPVALPSIESIGKLASSASRPAIAQKLRALQTELVNDDSGVWPLSAWKEFSGEGFDQAAVGSALGDAVHELERRGTTSASQPQESRPARMGRFTRESLTRLPEAAARLRAGLAGDPLPDAIETPIVPEQRAEILREAFALLQGICAEASASSDVSALRDLSIPGHYAVSTAYAWPQATRWAIQTFEALLGRAWSSGVSRSPTPLFGGAVRLAALTHPGRRSPMPAMAARACTTLAEQWLRCVSGLGSHAAALRGSFMRAMVSVEPLDLADPRWARSATGTFVTTAGDGGTAPHPAELRRVLVRPRVLTENGLDRSIVSYSAPRGVVCVTPYAKESFVVAPDGCLETHLQWPRPIVGELPWGSHGAVAWGNGLSRWPDQTVSRPYVMHRRHASDQAIVEELSVRPSIGAWWNGRLYFNCFPTPVDSWVGLASWIPGEAATREVPDKLFHGMFPAKDGLELHPCEWIPGKGYCRRPQSHGWLRSLTGNLTEFALTDKGTASSVAESSPWRATAYPDADLIVLESCDGQRLELTCHYPLRIAWCAQTLVVSTGERELFLFEDLGHALDDALRSR
jgi:hypothetical protein